MSGLSISHLQQLWAMFAWPWAWWLLPLPLLVRWLPPRRNSQAALRVPYSGAIEALASGRAVALNPARCLAWLCWFALCAALARPQQLGEPIAPPQQSRQMMLALDLSGSMNEPDMRLGSRRVDRLTAAKAVLSDFLSRRKGDQVGLLVFGERAYSLAPLTSDLESVRQQLRDSVVGLAGRETALGDAIGLSVKRLREQQQGQKVLVLLTDGVNTAGVLEPLKAAELARAEGVKIYTVALGSSGGLGSLFGMNLGNAEDSIDEQTLSTIAEQTGGRFFRARDTAELVDIYALLDQLEPVDTPAPSVQPRIELYRWPLLLALVLAGLIMLLPERWR